MISNWSLNRKQIDISKTSLLQRNIFLFHYYFSFTLTRILELRVARHIPVYERVNPKNELKILETRTTFIAKRQTLLTDAMSLCLKNVTYV